MNFIDGNNDFIISGLPLLSAHRSCSISKTPLVTPTSMSSLLTEFSDISKKKVVCPFESGVHLS